jgi:predicted DNA-binding transcriptional regulator AlpA
MARAPRKIIRLKEAMDILQVSRTTVRELIAKKDISVAPVPRTGRTSPIKLYESEIKGLAREWGIL